MTADDQTRHRSFRLTRPASSAPEQLRTSIVLPDREARLLLAAAERDDVSRAGRFSPGPAGVQWWSGPWDGLLGSRGSAEHLGSLDWSWDTPNNHYVTIYRVRVTTKGTAAGLTGQDVLSAVLALTGVPLPPDALTTQPTPSAADPFRAHRTAC